MFQFLKRLLIGRPLDNRETSNERMSNWQALAIFSSDALSSVAYGPEQIMLILAVPGLMAYGYLSNVAIAILLLLAVVTVSYVQISKANPGGGGSYSVAIHNLGEAPALVAAASLFADYTLTVAVSICAGTSALVSAFPNLLPYEVNLDLFILFFVLMLINLRGVRESSTVFVIPTYAFVLGILALIFTGVYHAFTQQAPALPPESLEKQFNWGMTLLILRAFANGCSSMTGIEAISNGVPMFKKPEVENATKTTYYMSGLLGFMFIGISFLIMHFHILPMENITALSKIAELTFGTNWFYYYIQITTMLILYLAANTSFNGLPPLLSILARDGYMPRYLGFRGDRLSFSNGIILLSIGAGLLIYIYEGKTENLISLYAIGVFLSFTIAQIGMVVHWNKVRGAYWRVRAVINGLGAVATGIVVLIIGISKFFYGAWVVLVFIPIMIFIFKKIKEHYNDMADQLHLPEELFNPVHKTEISTRKNIVIVPISSPTSVVAHTLQYAKSISDQVIAVHIATDEASANRVRTKWNNWNPGVELVTVYSPYRLITQPLIEFIDKFSRERGKGHYVTVLIPEFETKKIWHRLLHDQTGLILRQRLIMSENVIVSTIPFHLEK